MRYLILFAAVVLLVSVCLWRSSTRAQAAAKADLSVVFLYLTNNPKAALNPVRIAVPQNVAGLCALFRVTSICSNTPILYDTLFVEKREGHRWTKFAPPGPSTRMAGLDWMPGYSCLVALSWPPGLPTNTSWRLQLTVAREPPGFAEYINRRLHRELFRPRGRHSVASSEVIP
jgi:hypothetical protein